MNEIDESHFISTVLPKEKIAFLKLLKNFDSKLLTILTEEVIQGNKILNVASHVSDENIIVVLSKPFRKKYKTPGLKFGSSANPHDSGNYYSTPHPNPFTLIAPLK